MKKIFVMFSLLIMSFDGTANVKLPKIVGNNMILQRDANLAIWGWAKKGESVSVSFIGKEYKTKTGNDGKWNVTIPPIKAGGPYEMLIKGKNEIKLKNVLLGDVFLCSGQSNMGYIVADCKIYKNEIKNSFNPNIRQFRVENATSFSELEDVTSTGWSMADSTTVGNFSATAYFFAKKNYENTKVPVGIINSSWGGSSIEFWMSKDAIKSFPGVINHYRKEDSTLRGSDFTEYRTKNLKTWIYKAIAMDKGAKEKWEQNANVQKEWNSMLLPSSWENAGLADQDGIVWFTKEFQVPPAMSGKDLTLRLGTLDDMDVTWFNGTKIGETDGYAVERKYKVPGELVKSGLNRITVKVVDYGGGGGFNGTSLYVEAEGEKLSLEGLWQYKTGYDFKDMNEYLFAKYSWRNDWKPSSVYNAMNAPLRNYALKGIIWYQGENNSDKGTDCFEYRNWLKEFVLDYRKQWKNPNLGFICVQLPNWGQPLKFPSENNWSILRESQASITELPASGVVVTIDLGEANDIHPANKKDVGNRVAHIGRKIFYGESSIALSPRFESSRIDGNKIKIKFKTDGIKLTAKDRYGYVKGFAIAGEDKKFVWARAIIEGENVVIVSHDFIENPKYVRYAWANNPEDANLYNWEDLPAMPFRTDF